MKLFNFLGKKITMVWDVNGVQKACEEHEMYTKGTKEDFERMLQIVETQELNAKTLESVCKDISEHSADMNPYEVCFSLFQEKAILVFPE